MRKIRTLEIEINTVYMVSFFLGGAGGTMLGALAWEHYQWVGVSLFGLSLLVGAMVSHLAVSQKEPESSVSDL